MDVVKRVKNEMLGRMCDEQYNAFYLLDVVRIAGDGNYLEIGTLHGGTLCAAALWKKELGQKGKCYGIDPLDGYYMDYINDPKRGNKVDPITKVPVSLETVKENIKRFNVAHRTQIVQARSHPFPIKGTEFVVSYIDGDHWGDAPMRDWESVKDITSKFVVFDNFDEQHPDVMRAGLTAKNDPAWGEYFHAGITYIVRRRE